MLYHVNTSNAINFKLNIHQPIKTDGRGKSFFIVKVNSRDSAVSQLRIVSF